MPSADSCAKSPSGPITVPSWKRGFGLTSPTGSDRTPTTGLSTRPSASSPRRKARTSNWPMAGGCSTSAPTTISGSPTTPRSNRQPPRAIAEHGYGMASVRFICGTQDIHTDLEARISRLSRHGGHGPLLLLLRRQRRPVRDRCSTKTTPSSPMPSTMPRSSTGSGCRRPSGYRYANNDMTELENRSERVGRRSLPVDRHGWRLLDGRGDRRSRLDLRPGRAVQRHGDGRRFSCGRVRRRPRPRQSGSNRHRRPDRHPHRHAGQGAGRRQRRLHLDRHRDRCLASATIAALSVLQQPCPDDRGRVDRRPRLDRARR